MIKFSNGIVRLPTPLEWGTLYGMLGKEMSARMHCADSFPFWVDHTKDNSARVYFPDIFQSPEFIDKSQRVLYTDESQEKGLPIGFRPAFVVPSYLLGNTAPGELVVLNISMLMNEMPILCGRWSFRGEDIPDYVPGAILETQRLLHSPISYLRAYYVGGAAWEGAGKSVLIADRVLLKNISYQDLYFQGWAGQEGTI